jgi:hypothetical protein
VWTITTSTEDWLIASSVITEEKIRWAVNGFGSYKTAGEDGIFPGSCGFRLCSQTLAKSESYIFIPKPGSSSYVLAKSFRPISLTSFLLKSMERLMSAFLDDERAFDNTAFESMDHAAIDHGVCSTTNRWIDFMLR